jgi:NAD(P)-dependent dehydrogenase (short-subunit alcohol dehydrogenase family)
MCLLTLGANVGLGLEAARHLARMNPKKLILACRNLEKGQRAVQYINETTNVAKDVVETWDLDLSKFDNVKAFAKRGSLFQGVLNGKLKVISGD